MLFQLVDDVSGDEEVDTQQPGASRDETQETTPEVKRVRYSRKPVRSASKCTFDAESKILDKVEQV